MLNGLCLCRSGSASSLRTAAWMVGTSLALTLVGVALDKIYGDSVYSEALIYAAFPIAILVAGARSGPRSDAESDGDCTRRRPLRGVRLFAAILAFYAAFVAIALFADAL